MPIRHAIWKIGERPTALKETKLAKEQLLEEMIVAEPTILSDSWMLIGRQVDTGPAGRLDLLSIAPDGALVLIELKRNRTPRDVVAQALDYASWVEKLTPERIAAIYAKFAPNRSLAKDFRQRFGQELDDESLNQSHQIIIVAASLDDSTERIIQYLNARELPINVLFFQVFEHGGDHLLSRAWLIDPAETQVHAATTSRDGEPWNGEFYVSYGTDEGGRSWAEAQKFGFICGGGKPWYSQTLKLLNPGDRVWVKIPGTGFVGVGRVQGQATAARDFKLTVNGADKPALDVLRQGHYHRQQADDLDSCEYFVPVQWTETVDADHAFNEVGLFGNQNTVCKPTTPKWRHTVERLKEQFRQWNSAQ